MKPHGVLSDQHCHNWSMFSKRLESGVNSRLQITLDEMKRAAVEVKKAGGDTLFFAGDLFHTRGSMDPEVFNPTHATIKEILASGVRIYAIPGNHDNKDQDTTELGNAIQTIGGLDGFTVVTSPYVFQSGLADRQPVVMIPWCRDLKGLREAVDEIRGAIADRDEMDLIIHAGIDGVLSGVPAHGLTSAEIASWGFKRVFAGHYHHHCVFEGGRVISIGALNHQTFSDVGTKAGFLIVHEDRVEYRATHAPLFVDVTADTEEDELPLIADGNYVRVRSMKLTAEQARYFRADLEGMGAKGVIFDAIREEAVARSRSAASSAPSLEASVANYVDAMGVDDPAAVKAGCLDVLTFVRSASV